MTQSYTCLTKRSISLSSFNLAELCEKSFPRAFVLSARVGALTAEKIQADTSKKWFSSPIARLR